MRLLNTLYRYNMGNYGDMMSFHYLNFNNFYMTNPFMYSGYMPASFMPCGYYGLYNPFLLFNSIAQLITGKSPSLFNDDKSKRSDYNNCYYNNYNTYGYYNFPLFSLDNGFGNYSYNSLYDRYIMMYLSVNQRAIVYRDSPSPEGDWSGEKIIMYEDGNALYGPYIHPWFTDGKDLWFVLSHAVPTWNIFLMHADLEWDDNGVNIVSEGGFEEYTSNAIQYKTMWKVDASAMTSRTAHSGKVSCSFSNTGDGVWKDACTQTVTLRKNTDYTVECWIRPEKDIPEGAYVGVRLPDGTIHDVTEALPGDEWSKISRTFNSGDNSRADVFFGVWGGPEMKMLIDDICLKPVNN